MLLLTASHAPYCKVDYVLRGMSVPAGDHTIEFRFEPKSYIIGNTSKHLGSDHYFTYLLISRYWFIANDWAI